MAKFRLKPMIVEALTFDELMQYGLTQTDNIYNNRPWSFEFMGVPITHETDDCYIINGYTMFTENQMLIINGNELSVIDTDAFEIMCEPLEDNKKEKEMVKFEKVKRIKEDIKLPERSTLNSAGYDFFAIEDVVLPAKKLTRVMTGVKCELMPDMVLILANRSSNPSKKGLILANGIGIVDADYYGNPDNDGETGFEYYNILDEDVVIKKGEKLGQGMIINFIKTENDYISNPYKVRVGGFGSTGA